MILMRGNDLTLIEVTWQPLATTLAKRNKNFTLLLLAISSLKMVIIIVVFGIPLKG